ncbi:bifunctional GNAT family N-acetyltransferase/carbon-nitrogen hydrolase family protein [Membranihabitans maritimus]|uniref:bifunctional GNAT family N-acetyltransferase/carbon-nitrogen hydrolase family protein n=1 Tax=Membranihabitans maritimus TaxID=2904244 RepID=UPI001F2182B7|nr:bifunctional GNAT family N-acetyltransferase/carbon-nitrogen hydrolase family protein [Membranihabitans maritimus]
MNEKQYTSVEVRNLELSDYKELVASMKGAYEKWQDVSWTEEQIKTLITQFQEGQLVVLVDGKVAGSALSIVVDYKKHGDTHTYNKITGNDTFSTHDPDGDVLYGIDVFVNPEYRGMRLGRRLYDARKELCEQLNLRAIIFGGRIPNYFKYANEIAPKEYIDKVRNKEIDDPVLNFQLSNDFHAKKILRKYMPGDKESMEYAILLQWDNIYYESPEPSDAEDLKASGNVRLGLIQWQMRPYKSLDGVFQQIEYFVDAVSDYQSDFALFPEYFIAPLMANYNHLNEAVAIRKLAEYTDEVKSRFIQLAINYNINIITGSMPEMREDHLYNIGFLCRRDGTYDQYEKIHVTPDEIQAWGLNGGRQLKVFDTDCGKIGILICYDVEFPELPRLLAQEGINILFVPFLTDTQNAYSRVRYCAQARAIENECYVAIAGSVGNLPRVHNMDIQYAQSMVFTPCDFAFPANGIKAEATPNTEMILIADLDLDLLHQLHKYGSVRNLKDRRSDLYGLSWKQKKEQKSKIILE